MSRLARFGLGLWSEPSKILQAIGLRQEIGGVRYRGGCWPVEAVGDDLLRSVTLTDGRLTWSVECDYLACGFGLVANLELPTLLGCAIEDGGTVVDRWQSDDGPGRLLRGRGDGDRRARPGPPRRQDRRPGRRGSTDRRGCLVRGSRPRAEVRQGPGTLLRPPRRAAPPRPARHDRLPVRGCHRRRLARPDLLG